MERHINLDNTYLNVISFGSGQKNLVVIAGVSLTGLEGMGDALENALPEFRDNFTVYVFDRKKFIPQGYSIENMADDIYTCLKELNVEHTSVYGASQGGMIGQVLAIKHPELVENLIVCSTISRYTPDISTAIDLWIEAAKTHDVKKVNELFLEYVYSDAFKESIKDSIPALLTVGTDSDCERFIPMLEAIKSFDIYDSLDKIKCPTLVLGDLKDNVFNPKCFDEIAKKINCDIYLYDKYSHAVYDEAPDLKQKVVDFIKRPR